MKVQTTITTRIVADITGNMIPATFTDKLNAATDMVDLTSAKYVADDSTRKGLTKSQARRVAWYMANGEILPRITAEIATKFDSIFTTIESLKVETETESTIENEEATVEAKTTEEVSEETPTTDELETRIEKIKSRMSNMGILDTETETETETSDSSLKLQERKSAHEVYRQARQTFEEYADSDNADYEKTLNLHTAKQDAYKAYQQVAKA